MNEMTGMTGEREGGVWIVIECLVRKAEAAVESASVTPIWAGGGKAGALSDGVTEADG